MKNPRTIHLTPMVKQPNPNVDFAVCLPWVMLLTVCLIGAVYFMCVRLGEYNTAIAPV